MRIPYVVGRWVRGQSHYGRQRLMDYLLVAGDSATWLVGTRRMGKTSLLRQLEHLTTHDHGEFVPLFWDLQGCQSGAEMSDELFYALEESSARFAVHGIECAQFSGMDAADILRGLARQLRAADKQLLLLVDEAEVLIGIAAREAGWLGKLRKVLQEGSVRTIVTSTKLLAELNQVSAQWRTSPFLFGFNLANLMPLDAEASEALIRQLQAGHTVAADPEVIEDIIAYTNGHPYLIQYLCQRLFVGGENGHARLRAIQEEDLYPDQILGGMFQVDIQYLTGIERRLLATITKLTVATTDDVLAALHDEAPQRIHAYLYGLHRLGFLRQEEDRWAVGNEFLRRWLQDNQESLAASGEKRGPDEAHLKMLEEGKRNEQQYLGQEVARMAEELAQLEDPATRGKEGANRKLRARIERLKLELAAAQAELENLAAGS